MKPIHFSKKFKKNLKDLQKIGSMQERINIRIKIFARDRNNALLRDHALSGNYNKLRAFSITGDIRIIYKEYPDHINFMNIGTHSQVYR